MFPHPARHAASPGRMAGRGVSLHQEHCLLGAPALSSSLWGFACFLFQGHRPCLRKPGITHLLCVLYSSMKGQFNQTISDQNSGFAVCIAVSVLTVSANNAQGKSAWLRQCNQEFTLNVRPLLQREHVSFPDTLPPEHTHLPSSLVKMPLAGFLSHIGLYDL